MRFDIHSPVKIPEPHAIVLNPTTRPHTCGWWRLVQSGFVPRSGYRSIDAWGIVDHTSKTRGSMGRIYSIHIFPVHSLCRVVPVIDEESTRRFRRLNSVWTWSQRVRIAWSVLHLDTWNCGDRGPTTGYQVDLYTRQKDETRIPRVVSSNIHIVTSRGEKLLLNMHREDEVLNRAMQCMRYPSWWAERRIWGCETLLWWERSKWVALFRTSHARLAVRCRLNTVKHEWNCVNRMDYSLGE